MNISGIDAYLNAMNKKGVPGCEVIVCRDHQMLHEYRCGTASPDDRYFLYSCTKPVTAAAAMIAMEKRLFALDDKVGAHIPAYARKDGFNRITVRHLMTMSGGLDYDLGCAPLKELPNDASTAAFAEALTEKPLDFEPGTRFQYSLCHDVLAAVIEKTSGMTFGRFCEKYIFEPLGMNDTFFYLRGMKTDGIAPLYVYDGEKGVVPNPEQYPVHVLSSAHYSGGAGLVSTMRDYIKFADELATGGKRIMSPASVDLMRTEQLNASAGFSCTCGPDYGYGLGVRTRTSVLHGAKGPLGEFGWDGAAGADILIDPENGISMVYAQHVLNWPAMGSIPHLVIRDLIYGE